MSWNKNPESVMPKSVVFFSNEIILLNVKKKNVYAIKDFPLETNLSLVSGYENPEVKIR